MPSIFLLPSSDRILTKDNTSHVAPQTYGYTSCKLLLQYAVTHVKFHSGMGNHLRIKQSNKTREKIRGILPWSRVCGWPCQPNPTVSNQPHDEISSASPYCQGGSPRMKSCCGKAYYWLLQQDLSNFPMQLPQIWLPHRSRDEITFNKSERLSQEPMAARIDSPTIPCDSPQLLNSGIFRSEPNPCPLPGDRQVWQSL